MIASALALTGSVVHAHAASASSNEQTTNRYFATLVSGTQPKLAELTLFFSMMPKGGDLHHHYSGALYAEQYLDWVDQQHYCINKVTYRIETDKTVIDAERAKAPGRRDCLSSAEVIADNAMYRELLQRWSDKDFYNHGALQPPPDRQFFDTFAYFNPVSASNNNEGLMLLKKRAIQENLSYIETMFELVPFIQNANFDTKVMQAGVDNATLIAEMTTLTAALEQDQEFNQKIGNYIAGIKASSAGVDDARFTMRYQTYVLRFLSPSQVFSSMLAGFKAASQSDQVVGVNIVGAENLHVSMRDYSMHMQMFKFLKARYPKVKLALHAGELALGMVPPEGLTFHIEEAIDVAGANRIGHGIDLAHETDAVGIMKKMRDRDIAVEINLSSNEFILGVKNESHPVTLYRKYGVPFVLSTDDPGVSRNNLSGEYVLFASRYQTNYAEVKKLSYDSLRYSFLADVDKKRLLKALDARFAKFEADIASLSKGATQR
jgi:adenosine deaminase/adenosine deaminase CECR1